MSLNNDQCHMILFASVDRPGFKIQLFLITAIVFQFQDAHDKDLHLDWPPRVSIHQGIKRIVANLAKYRRQGIHLLSFKLLSNLTDSSVALRMVYKTIPLPCNHAVSRLHKTWWEKPCRLGYICQEYQLFLNTEVSGFGPGSLF